MLKGGGIVRDGREEGRGGCRRGCNRGRVETGITVLNISTILYFCVIITQ